MGERLYALWGYTFKCRFDLPVVARWQDTNLQIERVRRLLNIACLARRLCQGRIQKKADSCCLWHQLAQQSDAFWLRRISLVCQARQMAVDLEQLANYVPCSF